MDVDDSVQKAVDKAVGRRCGLVGYKAENGKVTQAIAVDGRTILRADFSETGILCTPICVDEVRSRMEDTGYAWTDGARDIMEPFLG